MLNFILFYLKVNRHMWLVATALHSTDLGFPFIVFGRDSVFFFFIK